MSKQFIMQQITAPSTPIQPGLHEYLLVAHPDDPVDQKIMAEKDSFAHQYRQKMAATTKRHITVANFMAWEAIEKTMLRYFHRICSRQQGFEVAPNNYSGFPPRTIYLPVQSPQPFRQIVREPEVVTDYAGSCSCPPARLVADPYLSYSGLLAKDLS